MIAAAEKLLDSGLQLRLYAFRTMPRILLSMAFPQFGTGTCDITDVYDTMSRQVVLLGCLQFPTHGMFSVR